MKALGHWKITKDSIRVIIDVDFCRFYLWLFTKAHYNILKLQLPKHDGHINIVSSKIHAGTDCSKYLYLNGKDVEFEYDIKGNMGGFSKGFKNFWLDVFAPEFYDIARDLKVLQKVKGFNAFHITIANSKNMEDKVGGLLK